MLDDIFVNLMYCWGLGCTTVILCHIFPTFKYYLKMNTYGLYCIMLSIVMLPVALLSPRDPVNILKASHAVRLVHRVWGINWKLKNKENIKRKGYIIVANHQSCLDAMGMLVHWDSFHPVVPIMKKEILYIAFTFGLYCWLGGAVFIDRGSKKGREALSAGLAEAKKSQTSIWVFPEGTRNRTDQLLLPFKKGAFHMAIQAQTPILPVVYTRFEKFYSRNEHRFDCGDVEMTVLPEIPTCGMTENDVDKLMETVREKMQAQLEESSKYDRKLKQ